MRGVLAIDPEQASASYQLGLTIIREIARKNEVARYPEALYNLARSLAVTGPAALSPETRLSAEAALKDDYAAYHGGLDGLDDLLQLASSSASMPTGLHVASVAEINEPVRKAHAEWAAAHPDLDLWETTKAALLEHGDSYFANLRDAARPQTFQATVVSQLSSNRILVDVDKTLGGDAILRFDGNNIGAVRPGTLIRFRGIVDSYSQDPYLLTFVVRNPKEDIVRLRPAGGRDRGGILARVFRGLFHAIHHLA